MQWRGRRESTNVEDRRGIGIRGGAGIGCGGLVIILILAYLTGVNPIQLLNEVGQSPQIDSGQAPSAGQNDEMSQFVRVVLADTEETWNRIFAEGGQSYQQPRLVLFTDQVASACGMSSSAVGPFYCPADQKVYLDLSFFDTLHRRFGAPGDFAQAYVIAHEVGHHVQYLMGIADEVHQRQQQAGEREANELSVRMELQADCFAGVWGATANRERQLLDPGDLEEGLRAAAAIGDDVIQKRSQGYTVPETWTHGSAEMRVEWFRRGFQSGNPSACNAF